MKSNIFRRSLVIGIIILFIGASVVSGYSSHIKQSSRNRDRGNILYVGGSGPGNYTKIQDAINNANNGDTVFVYDDSSPYFENLYVYKSINLIGENKYTTVINGSNLDYVLRLHWDGINISEFTIEYGSRYGIYITYTHNTIISGNIISNNGDYGILLLYPSSDNLITSNNIISTNYNGIHISNSPYNIINGNNITSNKGYGIYSFRSSFNTISGNNISKNGDGIHLEDSSHSNTISDNTISSNNRDGIRIPWGSNNNILNNNISRNTVDGIRLWTNNNNNIISGNIIDSNGEDGIWIYRYTQDATIKGNTITSNNRYGIYSDNYYSSTIYNNYFNNTDNAYDTGTNIWNITKTPGTNIIGGQYLGGNFWSDYTGVDNNGDGLGDTILPYNSSGNITYGGDWLPLVNARPYPPYNPDPSNESTNVPIDADLSWSGGDPDQGDTVTYDMYFGIASPPPQVGWNQSETTYDPGILDFKTTYFWQIVAWDNHGASNESPIWSFTTVDNAPPNAPDIDGPTNGRSGVEYDYIFNSIDPDGHDVYYYIYWGDSTNTSWVGPFASGDPQTFSHTWSKQGSYIIIARVKDVLGVEGGISILEITMPRDKLLIKTLFLRLLERFPILKYILGL